MHTKRSLTCWDYRLFTYDMEDEYLNQLLNQTDDRYHHDFCRLLVVILWNMY
ncbi:hypothetical protein [Phocaeicola faecalis]